jgi:multiple sugar transport system substrate-binding protein
MWTDASVFYGQLIDPEVSQVSAANVGVASVPRGPHGDMPYIITSWGMSISSLTQDMESSMAFLTWATSREMAERAMRVNIPMTRISVWDNPSITSHINPEIVETMKHASLYGYPYSMPFMTSILEARELIGEVISESINTGGTSPRLQELATRNNELVNDLLRADGEYGTAR